MKNLKSKIILIILAVSLIGGLYEFTKSQEKTTIRKEFGTDNLEHALNIIRVQLNDGYDYITITHNKDEDLRKFWQIKKYEITVLKIK